MYVFSFYLLIYLYCIVSLSSSFLTSSCDQSIRHLFYISKFYISFSPCFCLFIFFLSFLSFFFCFVFVISKYVNGCVHHPLEAPILFIFTQVILIAIVLVAIIVIVIIIIIIVTIVIIIIIVVIPYHQ